MGRQVLLVGAHPDDCDIKAGGLAALSREAGNDVQILSLTNGDAGHHEQSGAELAERRRREGAAAAAVVGASFEAFDNADGELRPTLENRHELIRFVRECEPDLLVTHRPNDYHPDHRYTAQLVRDAAYMVTVPNVCPETPHLEEDPVIAYFQDHFTTPTLFEPDVVVNVDPVVDRKVEMIHQHRSQLYEWLPYNTGTTQEIPDEEAERKRWIREQRYAFFENVRLNVADEYRDRLAARYGEERAAAIDHAEAFEIGEYGADLTEDLAADLFPWRA